ncbi:hypothetical protein HDU92_003020 [Lobulomyces angularis]|nr:hypothetical protein HDU92_003020 [Lobulomyces angularis]
MGKIVKERSYKTSGPGNKEVTLENFGGSKSCSLGKKEWKKQKKEMWLKKVADFSEKKDKKFNNKKKKMSEIPNMDSFKEAMLEITKNEEQKPKEEKNIKINKKAVSQKHRRKVALEEITRVQKILKYKKFSENPISIIQAHINNTIAN